MKVFFILGLVRKNSAYDKLLDEMAKDISDEITKIINEEIVETLLLIQFLQDESVFTGGVAQRESLHSKVSDVMKAPKATE